MTRDDGDEGMKFSNFADYFWQPAKCMHQLNMNLTKIGRSAFDRKLNYYQEMSRAAGVKEFSEIISSAVHDDIEDWKKIMDHVYSFGNVFRLEEGKKTNLDKHKSNHGLQT